MKYELCGVCGFRCCWVHNPKYIDVFVKGLKKIDSLSLNS